MVYLCSRSFTQYAAKWTSTSLLFMPVYVHIEPSSKDWIPIYNIPQQTCNIVLAHLQYVRRPTKRMQNGLQIFFGTISFLVVLSHRQIFASFVIWCITVWNLLISMLVKRHAHRTIQLFPTSNLTMSFLMCFGKATTNLVNRFIENYANKIPNVSSFISQEMKATDEEILASTAKSITKKLKGFWLSVITRIVLNFAG